MKRIPLIVMGAGGFGQEVVWAAENSNRHGAYFEILGYCDDNPALKGNSIYGFPVLGAPEEVSISTQFGFVCAIGDNRTREKVVNRLLALGWTPVTVIDPSVIVARGVSIGDGSYIGAGTILSPNASVGCHVIINHHCSIGHDSRLRDFAQAAPGVRVSGACQIGKGVMLGSNSVVAPSRNVGDYATVGAASFAVADVIDGATVVGVPARVIMK